MIWVLLSMAPSVRRTWTPMCIRLLPLARVSRQGYDGTGGGNVTMGQRQYCFLTYPPSLQSARFSASGPKQRQLEPNHCLAHRCQSAQPRLLNATEHDGSPRFKGASAPIYST